LLDKERSITTAGKQIEDLRVEKTDVLHSYKDIEKVNTDLVGENTSLHKHIHSEFFLPGFVFLVLLFPMTDFLCWLSELEGELLDAQTTVDGISTMIFDH